MKKFIIVLAILLGVLFCFASCNNSSEGGDSSSGKSSLTQSEITSSDNDLSVCETLNSLVSKHYSQIKIDITTTTGDIQLNAKYEMTDTQISYEIEQLNRLSFTEENSEDYKRTIMGIATVEDGEIIEIDGEAVELPSYEELRGSFNFSEENLTDEDVSNGYYYAKVISSQEFFGNSIYVGDLTVSVSYNTEKIQSITLNYKTNVSTVQTCYVFE